MCNVEFRYVKISIYREFSVRLHEYEFFVSIKAPAMSEMNPVDRRMKYPYTYTAKIISFPWAHYWKHAWLTKYYALGLLLTLPIMGKITLLANNPENVAKWKEIRRKMYSGEGH